VREPRLLFAVTLTVGLGVGANAAIFDAADQLLFRPLAVPHPGQVVAIYNVNRQSGKYLSSSLPDYQDYRQRLTSLQDLAAYMRLPLAWGGDHAERIGGEAVTPNFFETLQLAPMLGTTFQAHREAAGWPLVALVGENFWRARLGSDPAIVGRTLELEGEPFVVIGVVPRSFGTENLGWGQRPAVWIPLDALDLVQPEFHTERFFQARGARFGLMIGRLKPSVTLPEAQSQADAVAATLAAESPKTNEQIGVTILPAGRAKFYPAYRATLTRSLEAFAAASIFIFVLACLNLVNLLGERLLARERELAVRMALGGSAVRIVRQLLAEGLVLSLPGFGVALLLAASVQQTINRFPNVFGVGLALKLSMTPQVVESTLALSLLMALLFAAIPAVRLRRVNVAARLKDDQRVMSGGRRGWVRALPAAAQVVISALLAAGALLVMRSVAHGEAADLGFDRSHLVRVVLESSPRSRPADGHATAQAIAASLSTLPGVASTTVASTSLLDGSYGAAAVGTIGETPAIPAARLVIDAGFFETAGITIVRGRPFDRADVQSSEPVVVVSERLAHTLWPGGTQAESRLALGTKTPKTVRVIGVARDVNYSDPWSDDRPMVYGVDWGRSGFLPSILVKTSVAPSHMLAAIRGAASQLPSGIVMASAVTADELVDSALAPERAAAAFLAGMAVLAMLVAGIGLHGALAHAVESRRREIAIRIAVGGGPAAVSTQVLRPAGALALAAAVAGTCVSWVFTPLLAAQAKGVPVHDWTTLFLTGSIVALVCAAVIARSVVHASRTNPADALRTS
jgi:predicted permease